MSSSSLLAFIHIHKTGGTTVEWILRSAYGANYYEPRPAIMPDTLPWEAALTPGGLRALLREKPHLKGIGGHAIQPHMALDAVAVDVAYFTIMRDPVKMRASMYQHGVMALGLENLPLEKWLAEEQSQNRQTRMIAGVADAGKALQIIREKQIVVGLTERFNESMLLVQKLQAPNLDIRYRRMRVATDSSIARQVLADPETRALLMQGNEEDIALYQAVCQEIYPAQVREYGPGLEEDAVRYQQALAVYGNGRVSANWLQGSRLSKLAILVDPAPFNRQRLLRYFMGQQLS